MSVEAMNLGLYGLRGWVVTLGFGSPKDGGYLELMIRFKLEDWLLKLW